MKEKFISDSSLMSSAACCEQFPAVITSLKGIMLNQFNWFGRVSGATLTPGSNTVAAVSQSHRSRREPVVGAL